MFRLEGKLHCKFLDTFLTFREALILCDKKIDTPAHSIISLV